MQLSQSIANSLRLTFTTLHQRIADPIQFLNSRGSPRFRVDRQLEPHQPRFNSVSLSIRKNVQLNRIGEKLPDIGKMCQEFRLLA